MSDGSLPEKGPQDLLEAYQEAPAAGTPGIGWPDPGNGIWKRNAPQNRCRPEGDPGTGLVQGQELAELFSNCRLFVLPSHTEGLSLALLEAMSCGGRCLVSDIPANTVITKQYWGRV